MGSRQIPSSKSQIPTYSQLPTPNPTSKVQELACGGHLEVSLEVSLEVGSWKYVGIWDLELGI
jgi:hypothetical protein